MNEQPGQPVPRWALISLFAVLSIETALFVAYGRFNIDEGMHLNAGRLIFEQGLWPYRDYPFSQTTASPLLYGAASALFGTSLLVGRSLSALISLAGVGAMVWFAQRTNGRAAAAIVLLLVIANFPALWVFTQIRTEAPSICLATLATIAWFYRSESGMVPGRNEIVRWALAPSLLVWATAFRLTYAIPMLIVCLLVAWELRRSPRTLGWTAAVVALNGVIAALPMLVFFQESFFHVIEAQWSRAARLGWADVPFTKKFSFFGFPETGFHAVALLSFFPVYILVARMRQNRLRVSRTDDSENAIPASPLGFLFGMAALTYIPTLVFKVGFFQYFVNASLLLILAIGISIPIFSQRSKRHRNTAFAVFAVTWIASVAVSLAEVETWVSPEAPTIGRLTPIRLEIEQLTPDGCTMMTFETHLAVEIGCDVTPGLEYSYFSFFPKMATAEARERGVLNRLLVMEGLRLDPPEYVALTRAGAKRIAGHELGKNRPPLLNPMRRRYRLLHTLKIPVGPIHTFWNEVYLYARTDL